MTNEEARNILGAHGGLDYWWSEFIDPDGTTQSWDNPRHLATAALHTFRDDWEEMCRELGNTMDDVLEALTVAAGEAVENAPE